MSDERTQKFDWQPFNNYDYQAALEILRSHEEINFVEHNNHDYLCETAGIVWGYTLDLTQAAGAGCETRDAIEAADCAIGIAEDMIRAWTLQLKISRMILGQDTSE